MSWHKCSHFAASPFTLHFHNRIQSEWTHLVQLHICASTRTLKAFDQVPVKVPELCSAVLCWRSRSAGRPCGFNIPLERSLVFCLGAFSIEGASVCVLLFTSHSPPPTFSRFFHIATHRNRTTLDIRPRPSLTMHHLNNQLHTHSCIQQDKMTWSPFHLQFPLFEIFSACMGSTLSSV